MKYNRLVHLLSELTEVTQELIQTAEEKQTEVKPQKEEKEFLSADEAAEFLNVTKRSLFNYREAGLPFHQIYRKVIFKKKDLIEFIEKHKVQ